MPGQSGQSGAPPVSCSAMPLWISSADDFINPPHLGIAGRDPSVWSHVAAQACRSTMLRCMLRCLGPHGIMGHPVQT